MTHGGAQSSGGGTSCMQRRHLSTILTGARARMSAQVTWGSGCRRSAHSTHMNAPDATAAGAGMRDHV